jgi:hypothetical protein
MVVPATTPDRYACLVASDPKAAMAPAPTRVDQSGSGATAIDLVQQQRRFG